MLGPIRGKDRPTEVVGAVVDHPDLSGSGWDPGHIPVPKETCWEESEESQSERGRGRGDPRGGAPGEVGLVLGGDSWVASQGCCSPPTAFAAVPRLPAFGGLGPPAMVLTQKRSWP